ncbi:hypothetical protein SAMN04487916_12011 [Arthrobacter sp. ov407]|uniref:hypothetical protein n=1 Tax=Arthrobacter sp. ov407 TaxID=1761748 RepID=UPI000892707F|nr:hypothetical protein [Arthrobacter sp. ov407]SDL97936.1 hypothetical protein SAMN04487916_12011 [Arthrobacter sp. ov407]
MMDNFVVVHDVDDDLWDRVFRITFTNIGAPGPTITNIVATWGSQLAAGRLGPLMQATVPTPATAAQLAASITFLLSDDGTNVNGAILASDSGWSAL